MGLPLPVGGRFGGRGCFDAPLLATPSHKGRGSPYYFTPRSSPGAATRIATCGSTSSISRRVCASMSSSPCAAGRRMNFDAPASKFILRPAAQGDEDMLAQTRRLIEEVLPQVAMRWPRPVKSAA